MEMNNDLKITTYEEGINFILADTGSFAAEMELMGLAPDEIMECLSSITKQGEPS